MLIEAGADPNVEMYFQRHFADGKYSDGYQASVGGGGPPLSFVGDAAVANALLIGGADGDAALSIAASKGRSYVVAALLEAGVDANSRDDEDYTPLHHAARAGNHEVVDMLVEAGSDPNAQDAIDGNTPLHLARRDNRKVIAALLAAGADPTIVNADGDTFRRTGLRLQREGEEAALQQEIREREAEAEAEAAAREEARRHERVMREAEAGGREADRRLKRTLQDLNRNMEKAGREICRMRGTCP